MARRQPVLILSCVCALIAGSAGSLLADETAPAISPEIRREAMKALGVDWRWPFGSSGEVTRHDSILLSEAEWKMLAEEAIADVGLASDQEMLDLVGRKGVAVADLDALEASLGRGKQPIRRAFREFAAIDKWYQRKLERISVTDQEVNDLVAETQDKARIALLKLPVTPDRVPVSAVSEEELQRLFDESRTKRFDPDQGLIGYDMGYRIDVEYIGLRVADVIATQGKPGAEEIRARFDKEVATDGRWWHGDFAGDDQLNFDVVKDSVREVFLDDRALAKIVPAIARASEILQEPWKNAPVKDGFKVTPKKVKAPDYWQTVVARLKEETGLPWRSGRTGFHSRKNARVMPEIGSLFRRSQKLRPNSNKGMLISIPFYAFDVQGVIHTPGGARHREFAQALYEPSSDPIFSLKDTEYDKFLYRVVAVKSPGPPESMEEIRDYVLADARTLRAFDVVEVDAKRILQQAEKTGLEAAWASGGVVREKYSERARMFHPTPFSQKKLLGRNLMKLTGRASIPPSVEDVQSVQVLVDTVFGLAKRVRSLPPESRPAHSCAIVPLPRDRAYGVVELLDLRQFKNVTKEFRDRMEDTVRTSKARELRLELFVKQNVRRRWEARQPANE